MSEIAIIVSQHFNNLIYRIKKSRAPYEKKETTDFTESESSS